MATTTTPRTLDEDKWSPARIIPTSGIGGQDEQERRATSALLAVLSVVPEFAKSVLGNLGAPAGTVTTFVEVRLDDGQGNISIPDGAIVVKRGKTRWACLVEVKTGAARLQVEQVDRYLDLCRSHQFDALLTISSEITPSPKDLPVALDGRKLRRTVVRHLSWWHLLTEAIVHREYRGIPDPEQAWILGELIAYLDNERSGASGFQDMGDQWTGVRDAARQGTLRASEPRVRAIAERWEQLLQYLALGLRQDLGRPVSVVTPRGSTLKDRLDAASKLLCDEGRLRSAIKVPDAVANLMIEADLRSRLMVTWAEVPLPQEGRPKTRITWLLRQLATAPDDVRLEAVYPNAREAVVVSLAQARETPEALLFPSDPKRQPRSVRVCIARELGTKRGRAPGSFVHATKSQSVSYYREILQSLSGWRPKAPKLPAGEEPEPYASEEPPPFSSANGRAPGEGRDPQQGDGS